MGMKAPIEVLLIIKGLKKICGTKREACNLLYKVAIRNCFTADLDYIPCKKTLKLSQDNIVPVIWLGYKATGEIADSVAKIASKTGSSMTRTQAFLAVLAVESCFVKKEDGTFSYVNAQPIINIEKYQQLSENNLIVFEGFGSDN